MNWYKVSINPYDESSPILRLSKKFDECARKPNTPMDLALYGPNSEFPGLDYFLSPSAGKHCPELLLEFDAIPCSKPDRSRVAPMGSHDGVDDLLFSPHVLGRV